MSVVMDELTAIDLAAAVNVSVTVAITVTGGVDVLSDTAQRQACVTATAFCAGWRSTTLASPEALQLAEAKAMTGDSSVLAPRLRGIAASPPCFRLVMPLDPIAAVTLPSAEVSEAVVAAVAAVAVGEQESEAAAVASNIARRIPREVRVRVAIIFMIYRATTMQF